MVYEEVAVLQPLTGTTPTDVTLVDARAAAGSAAAATSEASSAAETPTLIALLVRLKTWNLHT